MSQDYVFHLLEGLSLIKKLVDNENISGIPLNFSTTRISGYLSQKGIISGNIVNFKLWASDITRRMISMMKHDNNNFDPRPIYLFHKGQDNFTCNPDVTYTINVWFFDFGTVSVDHPCNLKSQWYIEYPVQRKLVEEGSGCDFDTYFFFSYGAVEAGNYLSDNANKVSHFDYSDDPTRISLFRYLFRDGITQSLSDLNKIISHFTLGFVNDAIQYDFDYYKVRSLGTISGIYGPGTFETLRSWRAPYIYEHFPLYYLILHGDNNYDLDAFNSSEYNTDKAFYENLLNNAPCSGTRSYWTYELDHGYSSDWSCPSRLIWPEKMENDFNKTIEYSGMDYMLLHNLYYLGFLRWDYLSINIASASQRNVAGIINSTETISSGTVDYLASGEINLEPGFSARKGVTFTAKLGNICGGYNANKYMKTTYNDCPLYPLGPLYCKSAKLFKPDSSKLSPNNDEKAVNISSDDVILFPNPVKGKIFVKGLNSFDTEIFDLAGRKIHGVAKSVSSIDISNLQPGIYVVNINSKGRTFIKKIIKQ